MLRKTNPISIILLILFLSLTMMTGTVLPAQPTVAAKGATVNKPETRNSPEIPIEDDAKSNSSNWFGKYKWWLAIGGALIAGTAAALLSSGGSDEDGGDIEDQPSPTQYRIDW